jgi:hypothetical protein
MSSGRIMKLKRRCADILSTSSGYDRDLRDLCMLLRKIGR